MLLAEVLHQYKFDGCIVRSDFSYFHIAFPHPFLHFAFQLSAPRMLPLRLTLHARRDANKWGRARMEFGLSHDMSMDFRQPHREEDQD